MWSFWHFEQWVNYNDLRNGHLCLTKEYLGVFHLPKDSGKFREFGWEMFIGEERVLLDTRVPSIPAPLPVRCIPHQKYKMAAQLLCFRRNCRVVFGRRESREFRKWSWHSYPGGGCILYDARSSPKSRLLSKYFAAICDWWIWKPPRMTRGTIKALCGEV